MTVRRQNGEWPTELAPIDATVRSVLIDRADGSLQLALQKDRARFDIEIPAPWTFTSCLLSVSSAKSDEAEIAPSDLIGLEGASLSEIEYDTNWLDLVFGSIRISVFGDAT